MQLTWIINFRDELAETWNLLVQIRRLSLDDKIILIQDGHDFDIAPFTRFAPCCVQAGERLKSQPGGAWTERWLGYAADIQDGIAIKLDPDSWVQARPDLSKIPPGPCLFGSLARVGHIDLIRGGCLGVWPGAAARILGSGILREPCYEGREFTMVRPRTGEVTTAQDMILGHAADRLGIPRISWAAVQDGIQWREQPKDQKSPIVHPRSQQYGATAYSPAGREDQGDSVPIRN